MPAETVTVDGETETEKLLEEDDDAVEPELEQPESAKPKAVKVMRQQRLRICRDRRLTKSTRRSPTTLVAARLMDQAELEESFVALRKV